MKKADVILLIVILVMGMAGVGIYFGTNKDSSYVQVQADGETTGIYNLHDDITLPILTADGGENILEIRGGKAQISDANCPNWDCVKHKEISKSNESIVCLPHKVVITIIADETDDMPDAYAY